MTQKFVKYFIKKRRRRNEVIQHKPTAHVAQGSNIAWQLNQSQNEFLGICHYNFYSFNIFIEDLVNAKLIYTFL